MLTLHQPLATLIVAGFKRAEGRGWAHPYRGRLWIHAASKQPEDDEIAKYESFYTSLYGERGLPMPNFPSSYPTSCLVGCIDAEDQLQHEDYMEFSEKEEERIRNGAARDEWVWPPEENGSEYVFICHRPRQLVIPVTASDSNQLLRCGCETLHDILCIDVYLVVITSRLSQYFPPLVAFEDSCSSIA